MFTGKMQSAERSRNCNRPAVGFINFPSRREGTSYRKRFAQTPELTKNRHATSRRREKRPAQRRDAAESNVTNSNQQASGQLHASRNLPPDRGKQTYSNTRESRNHSHHHGTTPNATHTISKSHHGIATNQSRCRTNTTGRPAPSQLRCTALPSAATNLPPTHTTSPTPTTLIS